MRLAPNASKNTHALVSNFYSKSWVVWVPTTKILTSGEVFKPSQLDDELIQY